MKGKDSFEKEVKGNDIQGKCTFFRLPWVIKQYGTHLKASAAMVRLRLYDVLSQLPPESFEGI